MAVKRLGIWALVFLAWFAVFAAGIYLVTSTHRGVTVTCPGGRTRILKDGTIVCLDRPAPPTTTTRPVT